MRSTFLGVVGGVAAVCVGTGAWAASGTIFSKTEVSGAYKVTLVLGPAEMMSAHGTAGERVMGGKMSTCAMGKSSGMSMGGAACNYHLEAHVYSTRTGAVVTNARVVMTISSAATHKKMWLPIMTMESARSGRKDFHYGNNVHLEMGRYTVVVTVNGVRLSFFPRVK